MKGIREREQELEGNVGSRERFFLKDGKDYYNFMSL